MVWNSLFDHGSEDSLLSTFEPSGNWVFVARGMFEYTLYCEGCVRVILKEALNEGSSKHGNTYRAYVGS